MVDENGVGGPPLFSTKVAVWDRRSPAQPVTTLEHQAAVKALAWSPHRRGLLATGAGAADRHIRCRLLSHCHSHVVRVSHPDRSGTLEIVKHG